MKKLLIPIYIVAMSIIHFANAQISLSVEMPSYTTDRILDGRDFIAPSALAFDSNNRPYFFNDKYPDQFGLIHFLDSTNQWDAIDIKQDILDYLVSNTLCTGCTSNDFVPTDDLKMRHQNAGVMTITATNELYATFHARNPISSKLFPILVYIKDIHAQNLDASFHHFWDADDGVVFIEPIINSNNSHPPVVGLWEKYGLGKLHTSLNYSEPRMFTIYFPDVQSGLNLDDNIILSDSALNHVTHSGARSWATTIENTTYVLYTDVQKEDFDSTDLSQGQTSIVLASIDRTSNTLKPGSNVLFSKAHKPSNHSNKYPDGHCFGEIVSDHDDRLNIVIGGHGGDFYYYHSKENENILSRLDFIPDSTLVEDYSTNSGATYPSLVLGRNELLLTYRRSANPNSRGLYFRKFQKTTTLVDGETYSTFAPENEVLLVKENSETPLPAYDNLVYSIYTNWNHRLFTDRTGRIYNANTLRRRYSGKDSEGKSVCKAGDETCEQFYPWMLMHSDDGGITWKETYRHSFVNNNFSASSPLVPIEDSYVRDGNYANENFNDEGILGVKNNSTGSNRIAFLKFDLTNKIANNAWLELQTSFVNTDATTTEFEVHLVTDDNWDEDSIKWNNKPSYVSQKISSAWGKTGKMIWDLSDIVRKEMAGDGILSIAIIGIQNGSQRNIAFYSNNSANDYALMPKIYFQELAEEPVADAYVRGGGYMYDNFGSDESLGVKNDHNSSLRHTFLKFDLSDNRYASQVFLTLNASNINAEGHSTNYEVRFVDDDSWTEQSISFDNMPLFDPAVPGDPQLGSWNVMKWDITDVYNQELADDQVLSLAVIGIENGSKRNISFHSKESTETDLVPKLYINEAQIYPEADTYVRGSAYEHDNFGLDDILAVKNDHISSRRETYLRFDLTGMGIASEAILSLNPDFVNTDATSTNYQVKSASDGIWKELTLTWDNKPTHGSAGDSVLGSNSQMTWDITDLFNQELLNDQFLDLVIVGIESGSQRNITFHSKEVNDRALWPSINYVPQSIPSARLGIDNEVVLDINKTITVVYPNPLNDKLTIESEHVITGYKLVSLDGKLVTEKTTDGGQSKIQLNDMVMENGVFILTVWFNDDTSKVFKLIKGTKE